MNIFDKIGDFIDPEVGGKQRRKWLDEKSRDFGETMQHYLGPGVQVDNIGTIGDALNPVSDIGRAGQSAQQVAGGDIGALVPMVTDMAAVVAPGAAAKYAGGKATNAVVESLTGIGQPTARGARDAGQQFAADESGAIFPAYHGTSRKFSKFDMNAPTSTGVSSEAAFFSKSPSVAEGYGPNVLNKRLKMEDWLEPDFGGKSRYWFDGKERSPSELAARVKEINEDLRAGYNLDDDLMMELEDLGWSSSSGLEYIDGLVMKNADDSMDAFGGEISDNYAVFSPDQVLTPAQGEAQGILDLLEAGKGADVTDDMLAAADDMYLYNNYDLPMDEASRMARANEMGFDTETPLYHGTYANNEYQSLKPSNRGKIGPGVYMTADARKSNNFSGGDEPFIVENHRPRNFPLVATNKPSDEATRSKAWLAGRDENRRVLPDAVTPTRKVYDDAGFDGVSVEDERTILDPSNIRSRFARFDPRLAHLRNLSAGVGGLSLSSILANQPDEEELRAYLQ